MIQIVQENAGMKLPDTLVIFWSPQEEKLSLYFFLQTILSQTTAPEPQKRTSTDICLAYKNTHLEHPSHNTYVLRQLLFRLYIFQQDSFLNSSFEKTKMIHFQQQKFRLFLLLKLCKINSTSLKKMIKQKFRLFCCSDFVKSIPRP